MEDIEDYRAAATERWGTLLVCGLWITTTIVILLGWAKGLAPPWALWAGYTVLTLVAIVPRHEDCKAFFPATLARSLWSGNC